MKKPQSNESGPPYGNLRSRTTFNKKQTQIPTTSRARVIVLVRRACVRHDNAIIIDHPKMAVTAMVTLFKKFTDASSIVWIQERYPEGDALCVPYLEDALFAEQVKVIPTDMLRYLQNRLSHTNTYINDNDEKMMSNRLLQDTLPYEMTKELLLIDDEKRVFSPKLRKFDSVDDTASCCADNQVYKPFLVCADAKGTDFYGREVSGYVPRIAYFIPRVRGASQAALVFTNGRTFRETRWDPLTMMAARMELGGFQFPVGERDDDKDKKREILITGLLRAIQETPSKALLQYMNDNLDLDAMELESSLVARDIVRYSVIHYDEDTQSVFTISSASKDFSSSMSVSLSKYAVFFGTEFIQTRSSSRG